MTRHHTSQGFTLVELLIVILIMSILINLTLPSLKEARQTALVTRCLANQRQIATNAVGLYSGDYKGYLVPAVGYGTPGRVNPYMAMGFSGDLLYPSQGWSVSMWELLNPGSYTPDTPAAAVMLPVAYCPADKAWWAGQNGNWRETTYGLNAYLSYNKLGKLTYTRPEGLNRASEKALLIETHHRGAHGMRNGSSQVTPALDYLLTPMFPSQYNVGGDPRFASPARHSQGFTSSYVDGHALFVKHLEVFDLNYFPTNPTGLKFSTWLNYSLLPGGFYNPDFNATWAPQPPPWVP
jgi:prepilin-type N-terminal cleavage/methylation domain-containing protein